jgi:diacylglycerol kinase family enzyme
MKYHDNNSRIDRMDFHLSTFSKKWNSDVCIKAKIRALMHIYQSSKQNLTTIFKNCSFLRYSSIFHEVYSKNFNKSGQSALLSVTFRPMRLQVWIDKKFVDHAMIPIVGVANGQFFGGDMHIAPMAKTDDGLFEILYVKDTNIFKFLIHVLGKVYQAGHLKYKNVYHCQGRELKIRGDRLFLTDVDGEVEKAQEITVSLIPKAIKIRVPLRG